MPYNNLKQLGFTDYFQISLSDKKINLSYIRNLRRISCVYAIVADKKFSRLKGEADIVYIGQTKNIQTRVKTLFKDIIPENVYRITYNHTAREGMKKILNETDYKLYFTYLEHPEPKKIERKLLIAYCKNHIETPPLNNQRK